ncbi:hypothetical protein GX50_00812 [[Emmonsia] crescens]|uniref:N-acetyltransferase domain-containing protein n=1 Tax=[Emmonsia] crescens TaxID=73230 RepID=A0A2B7ZU89_9EURO|nr:hypothetical protein GX50_00812 [Emmonsia crescens]
MTVKFIRVQDPSLAVSMYTTGTRAFVNDGLQEALFPPRLVDPSDPDEQHRVRIGALKKRLVAPNAWSIAAVDDDVKDEDGGVKVQGYAAWYGPETPAVGDDQPRQDEEEQGWVEDGEGSLRGDGVKFPRCMDVKVYQRLKNIVNESKRMLLGEPARPVWYLRSLAVDPDFSGRGLATQLVQWGIDRAKEDNIPAFLESSPAALGLYKRLGFVVVEDLPPLDNGHVLTIMYMDPDTNRKIPSQAN